MAVTLAALAPPTSPRTLAARTRLLLDGPITPTLLRLAAPNVLVMVAQAAVSALDAYFVGWLGAPALAGVAVVFPLVMLMQTMSAGGMGGGVASAVARALGGGRRDDANLLAVHAMVIALAMATLFTGGAWTLGPRLYRAMGAEGAALDAAVTYSTVVFGGATAYWLFNTAASIVRGTGVMALPAGVALGASVMYGVLSPGLVLGWGPLPRLGVAGTATASVSSFGLGALVLMGYLASGRGVVRLTLGAVQFRGRLFGEILRVGAPGSLNTVLTNLTIVLLTGLVGSFGAAALAGYGLAARLEYLQIPLVFGLGSALVPMVGTNVGAGRIERAERVAWTGATLAGMVTGAIGVAVSVFPGAWIGLFTGDPAVIAAGSMCLRTVGPTYAFFGLGLALYFASQGAGRLAWPLLAGAVRLAVAGGGGWLVVHGLGAGLAGLFVAVALAMIVFGSLVAVAVGGGAWRRPSRS